MARIVLNDIIASVSFKKLIAFAVSYRQANELYKNNLPQPHQNTANSSETPPDAKQQMFEHILNLGDSVVATGGSAEDTKEYFHTSLAFLAAYGTEYNCKKELDALFQKALNG